MKLSIAAAATSQSVNVLIRDSTSTTGAGLAAVAPAGGALLTGTKLYYSFSGANASAGVAVSLSVLAAVNSAWSSAGIVTLDGTNMIGWVRIDLPNAALAASKGRSVSFLLYGGTNMAPTPFEIELTGWDNQDVVRGGMTALPNTACTTNASLLTSGTGTDQLSVTTGRVDVGKALGTAVTLDSNNVLNVSTKYVGGTSQTARDLGASVLLSTGTGTGQLDFTSGVVKANATQWLGGTIPAVNVTGVPKVDLVDWLGSAPNALQSGRVDGYVGAFAAAMGWGPIRSNTAAAGAAGTITLDASASATNDFYRGRWIVLTGGTGVGQVRVITTYTGSTQVASIAPNWITNPDNTSTFAILPNGGVDVELWGASAPNALVSGRVDSSTGAMAANVITAAAINAAALNGKGDWLLAASYTTPPTTAQIATGVWTDTTASDFTTALSVGKSIMNGVSLGTGLTVASVSGAVGSVTGSVGSVTGNVGGSVASVTAAVTLPSIPANWITAAGINAAALNGKGDWLLSSSYTTPPTAAANATAVWQDATAGDFTVANSIGKSLYTLGAIPGAAGGLFIAGSNAATTVNITGNITGTVSTVTTLTNLPSIPANWLTAAGIAAGALNGKGDWLLASSYTAAPTAAANATAIWQDSTAGDFTTANSIGKSLYNAFAAGTSVYTTAALANAPTGGSAPTTAQIATAVWQDLTSGSDFSTANSIGALLKTYTAPPTAAAVATAVWQDATAGDFTTANSIGKSLFNSFTAGTSVFTTAALANAPSGGGGGGGVVTGYAAGQDPVTLWLAGTIGGVTLQNYMRDMAAAVCGVSSGANTGTETYFDIAGSKAFVVTIDSSGNRSGRTQY